MIAEEYLFSTSPIRALDLWFQKRGFARNQILLIRLIDWANLERNEKPMARI